jgi:hypothetical protein
MVTVTQLAPFETPMIAMAHEDISGIAYIVVEPCVRIAHPRQVDLHERHDLETVDFTRTYQYEESESPLLENPLFDQDVEIDSLMGHLLSGMVCSDEDVPLIGWDCYHPINYGNQLMTWILWILSVSSVLTGN